MNFEVIATIIGSVLGSSVLGQIISVWFQKRKTEAEAGKTDADAASTLVDSMLKWQQTLTDRIAALETASHEKDKIISELRQRVADLEAEISNYLK